VNKGSRRIGNLGFEGINQASYTSSTWGLKYDELSMSPSPAS
jgi:hypothetical protein